MSMKKNAIAFLIAAIAMAGFTYSTIAMTAPSTVAEAATGAGAVSKSVKIGNFTSVTVSGPIVVNYVQDKVREAKVSGSAEAVSNVVINNYDSELSIRLKNDNVSRKETGKKKNRKTEYVEVTIYSPDLSRVDVSVSSVFRASSLNCKGALHLDASVSAVVDIEKVKCDALSIEGNVSGMVEINNVAAKSIEVSTGSAGSVLLSGTATSAVVESTSGGQADIENLTLTSNLSVSLTSGAMARFKGLKSKKIVGEATSGAVLTLKGTADEVAFEATSGAKIEAAELKADKATVDSSTGGTISYNARLTTSNSGTVNHYYK